MPVNRNALIRYKTIDNCLRNRQRRWTLEDLIEKVSDALYEYEGIDKGISRRSVQSDIQMMRSDKLGYNAPIIIVDKKYYTYEDAAYSITNIPITEQDVIKINEAVEVLKQFKGFSHFQNLNSVVQKLEAHVYESTTGNIPVIDFEKNEELKGLEFLEQAYQSIINKQTLMVTYQSFKARGANTFPFHVWWLKEFKNRWFMVGKRGDGRKHEMIMNLALDRIIELSSAEGVVYMENKEHVPSEFYKHVIGATVNVNSREQNVLIWVNRPHAPYVITKPLHRSQEVLKEDEKGIVIRIKVQLNHELEKEILGFGEGMRVLTPKKLRLSIEKRILATMEQYQQVFHYVTQEELTGNIQKESL